MRRFYFHLTNGSERHEDLQGVELGDLTSARELADSKARYFNRLHRVEGHCWSVWTIEIADENGSVILTIPVAPKAA